MGSFFGHSVFDDKGEQVLSRYEGEAGFVLMDVRIHRVKEGEERTFSSANEEIAVLLLSGAVHFFCAGISQEASRSDVFTEGAWCVHVAAGGAISVKALAGSELLVQCAENDASFPAELYRPKDVSWRHVGIENARRRVGTIFDHDISPLSNMVLGETINDKGNWAGYPPHRHPQPELYYFRFARPEGFGACFVGDEVFKSVDGSFSAIPGGVLHPQAAAPGYEMYTCWMIRHLPGRPWLQTDRSEDERYAWLHGANP